MQKVDHSKYSAHLDLEGVRMWSGRNGEEDLSLKIIRRIRQKMKFILFAPQLHVPNQVHHTLSLPGLLTGSPSQD